METLIIQVDCRRYTRNGPPQLGITVEVPFSQRNALQQKKQQQQQQQQQHHHNHHHHQDQEGLQITQIQPDSVIDRVGQFRVGDIIVEVNGVNLQRPFPEAQKMLKQFVVDHTSHGPLVLKVLRQTTASLSKSTSRHLVGALNTRKIGVKHRIKLRKAANGFGIKIAERDNMHSTRNRPIYITAITTTGSAYQDGRLREGDMLLEVNGMDVQTKTQPEVTRLLKSIKTNEEVEFLISRQEDLPHDESQENVRDNSVGAISGMSSENNCDKSLIDLDVPDQDDSVFVESISDVQFEKKIDSILNVPIIDGPGFYIYDIPLNDTKSAGLGLYLKYPCRADERRGDLGIWIEKVITGGAAWKDGRLQPDDQILAINGIDLGGLSNAEASETLTAAVCRGIGPEATLNTIRLKIHRRSPSVVAEILQGTNNRIECSDIIPNAKSIVVKQNNTDKNIENSRDSYQTALDNTTMQDKANDTRNSSGSSNQNSQNDSAMSPLTQASNSLKLANSCNDRSDQSSSDKTNETTSSAISQITDSTNFVPNNEFQGLDKTTNLKYISNDQIASKKNTIHNSDSLRATKPKSIRTGDDSADIQNVDLESSSQSWDDESVDAANSEDHFQRDGFGRQSISEKRHAQLNAKNTDTFRKNQRKREQREREQRSLEEQMARQRIDVETGPDHHGRNNMRLTTSYTTNEFKSIYGLQMNPEKTTVVQHERLVDDYHREVPVDVLAPPELEGANDLRQNNRNYYSDQNVRMPNSSTVPSFNYRPTVVNEPNHMLPVNRCTKCGFSSTSCMCKQANHQMTMENHFFAMEQRNDQMFKRSNSLESVQQNHIREDLIIPRAGTVRVARNRKVNESFRAAVDRSYEADMNGSSNNRHDSSEMMNHNQLRMPTSGMTKIASSINNSTTSTSNEERHLITTHKNKSSNKSSNDNGTANTVPHKKSSSLLTKFLKFGSIKRKKKNRSAQNDAGGGGAAAAGAVDVKSTTHKDAQTRDTSVNTRSRSHERSHSRTHSTQSHPDLNNYQAGPHSKSDAMMNGQMYNHNLKQAEVLATNHIQERIGLQAHSNQTSMPMCQYQLMHNPNTHHHHQQQVHPNHLPMTQAKYSQNDLLAGRHAVNNHLADHQPYSHNPQHHNQQAATMFQQAHHHVQQALPQIPHVNPMPVDHHHHHSSLYSSGRSANTHMMSSSSDQSRHISNRFQSNGCSQPQQTWQPQPPPLHFQASNGLWVTNSSSPESQQPHLANIYGTLAQHHHNHHQSNLVSMQQQAPKQQPLSMTSSHDNGGPIFSSTNGSSMNGVMQQQQAPIGNIQYHNNQMRAAPYVGGGGGLVTNHQYPIHGSQPPPPPPQQVYYYDF